MRGAYGRRIAADILRDELQMDGTPTSQLSDIFEREPAPLKAFISDPKYLNNMRISGFSLSDIQYNFIRNLEQIYLPETYIALVEELGEEWIPLPMKNMLILQWGKGSGKDSMCRIGVTRAADLLQCLKSPQRYFGLPENDDIHLLNVAASADQARRAFFAPMKRLFNETPYLSQYFRSGKGPAENSTSIALEKNIELVSGHSMADTQEGLNLMVGIADEISAFKTEEELQRVGMAGEGRQAKTAEQIVKMLQSSASSRFGKTFKVAQISYPRFKNDAIQTATNQANAQIASMAARGKVSTWYVSGPCATWDVNPRVNRDDPAMEEQFEMDPEMFASMYECKPNYSVNRFIKEEDKIYQAFEREIKNPIEVEYYWGLPENSIESRLAPSEIEGWQVKFHYSKSSLVPMAGAAYALHGDLAIKGDRAGIAMSHIRSYRETQPNVENEVFEPRPVIRNDFVFAFEADLKAKDPYGNHKPREIQIRWYRQLVWELLGLGFNVRRVTFDQFQSADMIQIFESRGVESKKVSLDRNDQVYQFFKDVLQDNRLESYKNDNWLMSDNTYQNLTVIEILGLRKLITGKIDHPPGGSKDCADALAGSVWGAVEAGGDEGDEPEIIDVKDVFAFVDGPGQLKDFQLSGFGTSMSDTNYSNVLGSSLEFG